MAKSGQKSVINEKSKNPPQKEIEPWSPDLKTGILTTRPTSHLEDLNRFDYIVCAD